VSHELRVPRQAENVTRRLEGRVIPVLEGADALVYALVALVFVLAAFGMLGFSVLSFPDNLSQQGFPLAIITLVNDLLLVMIITEVLRTVLSYLAEKGTSLRPFLFIAAISATRRILAIGARMSLQQEQLAEPQFQQAMIDLGVNAAVILAIAVALYLLTQRGAAASED
jgi:uncharacterized membrane protein (DUF373 family)